MSGESVIFDPAQLPWNHDGLLPVIAQQQATGEVLMLAWMNADALAETLETGRVCYWSRSRQRLWRKGERSGQTQYLRALYLDCDRDAVLLQVDQTGAACHTGRRSCFYQQVVDGRIQVTTQPMIEPALLYARNTDASTQH